MHDTTDLESRGIPSVIVATTEFEEAADAQAEALGVNPAIVFIPHPIQNRTDEEIRALADDAMDHILQLLSAE